MLKLGPRSGPPASLVAQGPSAEEALAKAIASGTKPYFRSNVYAAADVRAALTAAQFRKCVFCEVTIEPVATPNVEHFRPKSAYIHEDTGALTRPGYYWLTYTWANLMLACPKCNSSSKGNRFPLPSEMHRVMDPDADMANEQALLIDPFTEDPRDFIRFNGGVAYAVDGNLRGKTTIEVLGLNREALVDARNDHLNLVISVANVIPKLADGTDKNQLVSKLKGWLSNFGPYRSCLEDALSTH